MSSSTGRPDSRGSNKTNNNSSSQHPLPPRPPSSPSSRNNNNNSNNNNENPEIVISLSNPLEDAFQNTNSSHNNQNNNNTTAAVSTSSNSNPPSVSNSKLPVFKRPMSPPSHHLHQPHSLTKSDSSGNYVEFHHDNNSVHVPAQQRPNSGSTSNNNNNNSINKASSPSGSPLRGSSSHNKVDTTTALAMPSSGLPPLQRANSIPVNPLMNASAAPSHLSATYTSNYLTASVPNNKDNSNNNSSNTGRLLNTSQHGSPHSTVHSNSMMMLSARSGRSQMSARSHGGSSLAMSQRMMSRSSYDKSLVSGDKSAQLAATHGVGTLDKKARKELRLARERAERGDVADEPPPPDKHEDSSNSDSSQGDPAEVDENDFDEDKIREEQEKARLDDELQADIPWYFRTRSTDLDACLKHSSLDLFDGQNRFRLFLYNICRHTYFEALVIVIILMNCVVLAMNDPLAEEEADWITGINYFFVVAFTVEAVWKILAFGFVRHEGAYLKNNWNMLDFVIVLLSYLQFTGIGRLSSVRAVRVLRPLRSMNAIPELRALVVVLLDSLKGLLTVLVLTFFMFGIFGIFGVQLFAGILHTRCTPLANETHLISDRNLLGAEMFCNPSATPGDNGLNGASCPDHFYCKDGFDNPNFGKTSFDNFFWTLLLIIQTLTFEDWASQMYMVMAASTPFAAIYFALLIIAGGYMLLNLALAIISFEFEDQKQKMERKQQLAAISKELFEARDEFHAQAVEDLNASMVDGVDENVHHNINNKHGGVMMNGGNFDGIQRINSISVDSEDDGDRSAATTDNQQNNNNNTGSSAHHQNDGDFDYSAIQKQIDSHVIDVKDSSKTNDTNKNKNINNDKQKKAVGFVDQKSKNKKNKKKRPRYMSGVQNQNNSDDEEEEEEDDDDDDEYDTDDFSSSSEGSLPPRSFEQKIQDARDYVFDFVEGDREMYERDQIQTTLFSKFIILCILANTAILAADHYGASEIQETVGSISNLIFTVIFCIEIVLKVFALGPWLFCQSGFNVFDFFVVLISLVELGFGGNSQFSVFRAFRLLRVLKLLKKFPSLLKIVNIIGRAVKETAYMNVLVLLYLFVASLFGMSFFGGKLNSGLEPGEEPMRSSFDSFGWSFLTVFQILTRDDWPNLMFAAMRGTTDAASLYFLFCVFFGDLVILNLFLSIVISTFELEDREVNEKIKDAKMDPRRRLLAVTAAAQGAKQITHINYQHTVTAGLTGNLNGNQRDAKQVDATAFRQLGVTKTARDFMLYDDPVHASALVHNNDDEDDDDEDEENDEKDNDEEEMQQRQQKDGAGNLQKLGSGTTQSGDFSSKQVSNMEESYKLKKQLTGDYDGGNNANDVAAANAALIETRQSGVFGNTKSGHFVQERIDDHLRTERTVTVEEMMFRDTEKEPSNAVKKLQEMFGRNRFADVVLAAQAANENTIGNKILAICPKCQDPIVEPFNLDSHYYQSLSPLAQHEKICDRVQVRKARSKIITKLMYYIQVKEAQRPLPYAHEVEEIFGTGWEVGILLGDDLGEHLANPSWERLSSALQEEAQILCLRVGEDYIGGALITFTTANTPTEKKTNGGDSLWLFGPQNRFRVVCTNIMSNTWFDSFILVCIVISSVILAFDTPRNVSPTLNVLGDVFSGIFVFEAVVKIVALGFLLHRNAYLRDAWNILDFFIVIVALIDWIAGDSINLSFLKVFRTFRALRPLRVINRNQGLKTVVVTLFESFKGIFNVALITVLIWLIFAILGTQLYGGTLYYCTDESISHRADCAGSFINNESFVDPATGAFTRPFNYELIVDNITNRSITIDLRYEERRWVTTPFNFDNTYNSFLLLFGVSTLDAWSERMYQVIDAQGIDIGPKMNNQPWMAIYFLLFIIIGSFFLLSLFVGVVIAEYGKTKNKLDCPWPVLDEEQKHWVETQRMVLNFRPVPRRFPPVDPKVLEGAKRVETDSANLAELVGQGAVSTRTLWRVAAAHDAVLKGQFRPLTRWEALRVYMFEFVESISFEIATGTVVLLSIAFIALEHYQMSEAFINVVEIGNIVFVALFVVEMLLKWLGLGFRQYFLDPWSQFDFFLVVVGLVGLSVANLPFNVNLLRILRVFRTMRLLALVRRAKRVRILLETLWFSLPALGNVTLFLMLVFFIYSILGVQLFTYVKPTSEPGEGGVDDLYSNFKNFGTSFLILVRIATMDNWAIIMADVSNTKDCGPSTNDARIDDCGTPFAPLYFFTFLIIAVFVLLNILVAIILDNFNTAQKIDHSDVRIQDLKQFADEWTKYDPDATMKMETRHFWKLIAELKPPLGIARRATRSALLNLLHNELWIPEHEGKIHFIEALVPLARRTHIGAEFTEDQIREHEIYWHQQVPQLAELPVQRFRQKRIGVQHYFAQQFIASAFRRHQAKFEVDKKLNKKIAQIKRYYDECRTPEDERVALHKLQEKMEKRKRLLELEELRVLNSARDLIQRQQMEDAKEASGNLNSLARSTAAHGNSDHLSSTLIQHDGSPHASPNANVSIKILPRKNSSNLAKANNNRKNSSTHIGGGGGTVLTSGSAATRGSIFGTPNQSVRRNTINNSNNANASKTSKDSIGDAEDVSGPLIGSGRSTGTQNNSARNNTNNTNNTSNNNNISSQMMTMSGQAQQQKAPTSQQLHPSVLLHLDSENSGSGTTK